MAFCKFCGRALQEGEVCNCQAAAQAANSGAPVPPPPVPGVVPGTNPNIAPPPIPAPAPNPNIAPPPVPGQPYGAPAGGKTTVTVTLPSKDAVNEAAKNVFSSILGVLARPVTGGSAFVQGGNKIVALILMGIQAVFSCIFSLVMIGKINSLINLATLGSGTFPKFSGIKAFFVTLLFSVIFSALMTGLIFVVTKITKITASLDQVLALSSVRSIAAIPMSVLAIILGFINPAIGFAMFFGSILLTALFLAGAIKGLENAQDDKAIYAVFGVIVVFVILFLLIGLRLALGMYVPSELNLTNLMRYLN